MILVHRVFDHLKKVAIHRAGAARAHTIVAYKNIPARQQGRGFGTKVSEEHSAKLLNFVCGMAQALPEGAVGRLARHLENFSFNVIEPTMIAAAQTAIFDMAKLQRGSAMRAAHLQKTVPPLV